MLVINPNELDVIVNCLICSNIMQEPTTMHCGHSFCQTCAIKWCIEYKHYSCPVCRKKLDHSLPNVNLTLKLLIDYLKQKSTTFQRSDNKNLIHEYNKINKSSMRLSQSVNQFVDHEHLMRKISTSLENKPTSLKKSSSNSLLQKSNKKNEDSTMSRLSVSFCKIPVYIFLTFYGFMLLFVLKLVKRLFIK